MSQRDTAGAPIRRCETRRRVDERLEALYRRHLELGEADDNLAGYYSSEHGYYESERVPEESDTFSVCLVSVDGDFHTAGSLRQTAGACIGSPQ